MIIFLDGAPCAGKSTVCAKLIEYCFTVISCSGEFRKYVEANSDSRAERIKTALDNSKLVSFEDWCFVIGEVIKSSHEDNLVLDGVCRTRDQAIWLCDLMQQNSQSLIFIQLEISLAEVMNRRQNRFYVTGIEKPFSSLEEAQRNCRMGELLIQRIDDQETETVIERFNTYQQNILEIMPVIQQYAAIYSIDASLDPNIVFQEVFFTIENE